MNFSPSRVVNQWGLFLFLTVLAFVSYFPSARAGTLSVTNGSFTNLTGLVNHGGGWYGGIPAGWSTATTPANAYTVQLSGGTYYANLQTLGGTAPFAPLRQNVGAVDITSDVTLTFTLNTLSGASTLGSAIYDLALPDYTSALSSYSSGSITSPSTVSYTARGVGPGTSLYIAFWNGSSAAGISGVSIDDSATTYAWNGGVSGAWTNGGGGWTDKFDNTAATYNNAKPVVAQFTNAAAGTSVSVAAGGVNVGNIQVSGANYDFSGGTITMTNTTWSVGGNATNTVASALAGTTGLTKSDTGTLALSASNSYSGGTTVNAGTLALQNANALGSGNLTVNGGTLDLGGDNLTAANLGGTGGTISLGTNTLTASMSSGGQFNGAISGSGGLVKTGASFLTLAGSNSYTGGTTVNAGTLFVIGSGTLGDAAGTVTIDGSGASLVTLDLRNQQTRTGTIAMNGQNARLLSGDVNNPGSVVNNGSALQFGGGLISASISGTGGLNVTAGGSINSSNSYTGATTISNTTGWYGTHTLYVDHANALGAASGALTIAGGTVSLKSNTITRTGDLTISGGYVHTGTLSKSGSDFDIQGGTIGTVLAGTAGLTKAGTNTAVLGAANTYSGATTVNGGTLQVASGGSISSATTVNNGGILDVAGTAVGVTVNNGGTIKGSGTVGALTIASGGILAVGNSPGTLTASSAAWNGGGKYSWEFSSVAGNETNFLTGQGTNWDFLNVTGELTIGASSGNEFIIDIISLLALNDTSFNQDNNYSFAIATAAGGISGFDSSDFSITGYLANSNKWSLGVVNNTGSSQSLVLAYTGATAIPEPSTGVLFLSALGILGLRRRFSVK